MFLLVHTRQDSGEIRWVGLGLVLITIGDLVQGYILVNNTSQTIHLSALGRVAGICAIGIGALQIQNRSLPDLKVKAISEPIRHTFSAFWVNLNKDLLALELSLEEGLQAAMPLISIILLGVYCLLAMVWRGQTDPLGLWMTMVLGLFLVARQGMLAGEREYQQYTILVNSIAEPAFICNKKGQFKLINPAMLESIGYSEITELLNKPLPFLLSSDLPVAVLLEKSLDQGWSGEANFIRKDGSTYPVYLSLRPFPQPHSEKLSLAGTAHDLTLQKSQQQALQSAYEQVANAHHALENLK